LACQKEIENKNNVERMCVEQHAAFFKVGVNTTLSRKTRFKDWNWLQRQHAPRVALGAGSPLLQNVHFRVTIILSVVVVTYRHLSTFGVGTPCATANAHLLKFNSNPLMLNFFKFTF